LHDIQPEAVEMERRRAYWRRIAVVTLGVTLCVAGLGRAQFTSMSDRSRSMLEGHWQSCRDADGHYSERVYDGKWPGMPPFELHMGPFHEFALFKGIQDYHRDHNAAENLLRPHKIELQGGTARHMWDVAGLRFEATLAGGSSDRCESWYVTLKRSTTPSSD
jgi:hypothetical protein